MTDSSTQSITIAAPPADIMAVIADFGSYPDWTGGVREVTVLEPGEDGRADRVRFTIEASVIKDTYELEYVWAADGLSVAWSLASGSMQKSQDGSYTLAPLPNGDTEVTYSLSVQLAIPMIGMLRRKAERTIMDTALKELKKRVEGA